MSTNKQIKLIGTIIGILLFVGLIVGLTYAWFTWRSNNISISGTTECFDIIYTNGQDLEDVSTILFDESNIISNNKITIKNGMALTDVTAYIDSGCDISANMEIKLNIEDISDAFTDGDSVGALKYVVASYDPSIYSDITTDALSGIEFNILNSDSITSTGEIVILDTLMSTTETGYLIIFYVDGDMANNDAQYATFSGRLTGIATQVEPETLAEHITNLYINADKTVVTNNGIDYNYASSVRLMNDRLGDNNVDADAGNIRYYGADDSNLKNHIYFNCSDYSNQSSETCETWRIIGIVDGKVKLIRSSSIGGYAWDDDLNDWNTSTLKDILNSGEYYSSLQTKNSKTIELIADATWYTNGMSDPDIYTNTSYIGERTGSSTWPGKIALAYPSDYGYSADLNGCSNTLLNYDDESCTSINWLTSMFTLDYFYWLLTPYSDLSDSAWDVLYGFVDYVSNLGREFGVLPVLYLDPTLSFNGVGDGSSGNPYQLLVE